VVMMLVSGYVRCSAPRGLDRAVSILIATTSIVRVQACAGRPCAGDIVVFPAGNANISTTARPTARCRSRHRWCLAAPDRGPPARVSDQGRKRARLALLGRRVVCGEASSRGRHQRRRRVQGEETRPCLDELVTRLENYSFSTFLCVPNAVSQGGRYTLGAQAIRDLVTEAGFTRFRRAAETPFNLVYEVRP
jgi:hypothetical protein